MLGLLWLNYGLCVNALKPTLGSITFPLSITGYTSFHGPRRQIREWPICRLCQTIRLPKDNRDILLERFYNPYQPMVLINETTTLETTIRSNLTIGLGNSEFIEINLIQVCEDAGIHDPITSLPDG
ncbi:hypothetical protein ASPFODRAFT_470770 [Aspergillus luchuensis CBS 106.47]|uniref:Uncharacterized protein n=1 Tax=Aspergillus luchuensis (strain CBS 106.47) TaxID=1137211 RepID=A0A1M3SZS9_ASPLC|nr:hypothetical protein ASPFODRAFT_470770 [Aspergillus luchuensis CBS 106.47]